MVTDADLQRATDECMASLDAVLFQPEVIEATGYQIKPILVHYGLDEWIDCVGCGQASRVAPIPGCPVHDPEGQV